MTSDSQVRGAFQLHGRVTGFQASKCNSQNMCRGTLMASLMPTRVLIFRSDSYYILRVPCLGLQYKPYSIAVVSIFFSIIPIQPLYNPNIYPITLWSFPFSCPLSLHLARIASKSMP